MDLAFVMPFLTIIGCVILVILGLFGLFKAFYIKVPQGTALIVNDMTSQPKVHFIRLSTKKSLCVFRF